MVNRHQRHTNVLIASPEVLQDGQVGERGFYYRTAGLEAGESAVSPDTDRICFTRMVVHHRCYLQRIGFRIAAMGGQNQVHVRVGCYTSCQADTAERPYRLLTQASYRYTTVGAKWAAVPRVELEPGLYFLAFLHDNASVTFVVSDFVLEGGIRSAAAVTFGTFPTFQDPDNGVEIIYTDVVCLLGWLKLRAYLGR